MLETLLHVHLALLHVNKAGPRQSLSWCLAMYGGSESQLLLLLINSRIVTLVVHNQQQ